MALGMAPFGAAARLFEGPERALSFQHLHTGETVRTVYWAEGNYVDDGQREINKILRDWRTDEVTAIDPALMDFLFALRRVMATKAPFQIISGYRSPATNAMLRQRSKGVAKRSLHMLGMATDVRLAGRDTRLFALAARNLKLGGVGYYGKPDFIHLDTGRVRSW